MEIQFETPQLREACLVLFPKGDGLPQAVLSALRDVYNEMRNADHLNELVLGAPRAGDLAAGAEWLVPLAQGYRTILRVNHNRLPMGPDGIDPSRVHRVRIMSIEAPND